MNMSGITSSRPIVKAAATLGSERVSIKRQVTPTKRRAARGARAVVSPKAMHEVFDRLRLRAALAHRGEIELEMARVAHAAEAHIRFFSDDDLVDQPAGGGVAPGRPRQLDARELALQRLEQRHEIPHGEDVMAHEPTHVLEVGQRGIDRVGDEPLSQRLERTL